ncbi:hypothetical protein GQ43DRAFT_473474 [Delitschia confertaspora ATCC 74209]|uniref:Uncharacterized protein n=1 Tax=Delitschia confertaspora ATCC 74209 TaxID=1513339 RepID=A0A9P4JHQ1_9PLEO|nr:hypothetical protein GQ43DRAFT_473474 [Delitschia confertaspora ATCC 74209]
MDSRTRKKRPWEEEARINNDPLRFKGRGPPPTAGERHPPLVPRHAGFSSHGGETLSQRRLPPLYTPTCAASADHLTYGSLQPSPTCLKGFEADKSRHRLRSQSLFDVLQQPTLPQCERNQNQTVVSTGSLDLKPSPPPVGASLQRSRLGAGVSPHRAGAVICCPLNCGCQVCYNTRHLMRKLALELRALGGKVRSLLQTDGPPSNEHFVVEHSSTGDSLQWALDLVQWINVKLQGITSSSTSPRSESEPIYAEISTTMRRGQPYYAREDYSPPLRPFPGPSNDPPRYQYTPSIADDGRRNPYSGEMGPMGVSPHHSTSVSSSGSAFLPPQSPMQAPQTSRSSLLPSPSSMNFQNIPNLPPISSPPSSLQKPAQTAHFQDLQHQINIKTLALQTLQREYDALLQKLEGQRSKTATLEKKFQVSDIEINTLTDEKERLQHQVTTLEVQVEELQQGRDEARRQLVANGAQYMRILDMGNRLQEKSSEDKKRWDGERRVLEGRIRVLEEAMVMGTSGVGHEGGMGEEVAEYMVEESTGALVSAGDPYVRELSGPSTSTTETINVLRAEVVRLRSRTLALETALQAMKEESISIQAAARQLVESGGKIEKAVDDAVN